MVKQVFFFFSRDVGLIMCQFQKIFMVKPDMGSTDMFSSLTDYWEGGVIPSPVFLIVGNIEKN